ncbi:ester cyclase [Halolamina litorea]|uniref:Ester cyclase n=1 Tax=Halolamina litorea TaxID=1515593 RepID=A0ABD6BVQ7_9EURY|nr:ester cyclase [Halolamina litorea]
MTTTAENKRTARRVLEEVIGQEDLDAVDDIYTEDAVEHTPMGDISGHEGIRESFRRNRDAFSDYTVTVEEMIAEGDTVAVRLTERGTHDGAMMGIDPTGKEFEHQTMAFMRFEDGRVAEWWVLPDSLGLMQQLGVVEHPGE